MRNSAAAQRKDANDFTKGRKNTKGIDVIVK